MGEQVIYAVPGVPYEMREILERAIIPDLRARGGVTGTIRSRTLRTWGESESGIAERVAGRLAALDPVGNPTIAFLASGIEGIKVRITAKADDAAGADALLDAEEAQLRSLLGPLVFGVDDETMEHAVLRLLEARGLTLGVAESLTGGLIAARLCDVPGASRVLRGSIVSYASDVKRDVLGIPDGPVVSAAAVEAMAAGARRVLGADVALAVTGVAGPDPQEGHEPGTVFVGLDLGALGDGTGPVSIATRLPGDRRRVREFTVITALGALRHRLLEIEGPVGLT